MKQDNGYYTPATDDICVGYEYEFHGMTTGGVAFLDTPEMNIAPSLKIWTRERCNTDLWHGRSHKDILKLMKSDQIRVPYLTKEQIEAEGWTYTGKTIDIWFEMAGSFEQSSWTAYKAQIHYGLHDQRLTVTLLDPPEDQVIFIGECKSINEFRKIMKLLKIK